MFVFFYHSKRHGMNIQLSCPISSAPRPNQEYSTCPRPTHQTLRRNWRSRRMISWVCMMTVRLWLQSVYDGRPNGQYCPVWAQSSNVVTFHETHLHNQQCSMKASMLWNTTPWQDNYIQSQVLQKLHERQSLPFINAYIQQMQKSCTMKVTVAQSSAQHHEHWEMGLQDLVTPTCLMKFILMTCGINNIWFSTQLAKEVCKVWIVF